MADDTDQNGKDHHPDSTPAAVDSNPTSGAPGGGPTGAAAKPAPVQPSGLQAQPTPESVQRLKMVDWYDPSQLVRTGIEVLTSNIFGRHSDFRLMEALADSSDPRVFFDHTSYYKEDDNGEYVPDPSRLREKEKEIWIDYVGDVGDGWDSTYAVAYHLAQPQLTAKVAGNGAAYTTRRGDILVFGGDQVYPIASRKGYDQRLVHPYEAALRNTDEPHPHAYAIPGNHDWYDSLVSFTRLFCERRWFGGWRTQQCRSYFALKLPHGWWLLGSDVQLGSDIDGPQVAYFKKIAEYIQDTDRIILCNAEPHWIYEAMYGTYDAEVYNESNLAFLEDKVLKKKISVFLAGDLHHYRRHEAADQTQKITSGGGGAFLHPTHGPDVSALSGGFRLKASFPDPATSRRLCWNNFKFPVLHKTFGVLMAMLYVLTARSAMTDLSRYEIGDIGPALKEVLHTVLIAPVALFWVLAVFLTFFLFTDTHSRLYRFIAGSAHGLAHLCATFLLGWGATCLTVCTLGFAFMSSSQLILGAVVIALGGWAVGSLIMGIYLFVSLNWFNQHSNEAFSSLAIPDYKNFLRLKIDADGALTIFPIGIRRVPRRWRERGEGEIGSELIPDDMKATGPELIEDPITIASDSACSAK
jgi:hypothetical protein